MTSVAVIDYGMGNLRSVAKALEHVGAGSVEVTYDAATILQAERVVFPGVGALGDCMRELKRLKLDTVVRECARTKPFLGICLGMQALMDNSEESGGSPGLGIIPGGATRFNSEVDAAGVRLKVPHMGWNQVHQRQPHPLWEGIAQDARFYFVHSYYVTPSAPEVVAGRTQYGVDFVSAVAVNNVFATQFHPEKSQRDGLMLLANFVHWNWTE
jgi:imidazole glycerol-phosphate synthase subunit HisH